MPNSVSKKLLFIFGILICYASYGQQDIVMTVHVEEGKAKSNLIDVIVGLSNTTKNTFDGFLRVRTPEGFRTISEEQISISLSSEEKRFVSTKLLVQHSAQVGTSKIEIDLLDANGKTLQTLEAEQAVAENNSMRLSVENPLVFMNNPNDSLAIKVVVSNLGNRKQNTSVVFSIPELLGENNFFEEKGVVNIQKDTEFVLRFLPPKALLKLPQFTVQVAAMRGSGKELFGNLAITVQNISSVKQHQDLESARQSYIYQKNSLTTTYRKIGEHTNVYQIIGSGEFDLSAGYLEMSGNLYMTEGLKDPFISNTYLAYYLDNYQFKVGNISQPLEMSLYGRGFEASTTNETKSKKFQVGFIDQNFNLMERDAFLKKGYGMYASGVFGNTNAYNYTSGSYIFKEDIMENTQNHMIGIEKGHVFSDSWRLNIKGHGALSQYNNLDLDQSSFALETQYWGKIQKVRLSGNYFLSSDYFPGNRRGVLQLHQNATKSISKNRSIYSNIFISNFSPKSHTYNMTMASTNFRFDMGINFPRRKLFGLILGFQHQTETNNNYGNHEGIMEIRPLDMKANRLTNSLNWASQNQKHSVILGLEEGVAKYSDVNTIKPQVKTNIMYSFWWLNASAIYQYGSFYLSEYALTLRNANETYQRLMYSIAADKNFMEDKLSLRSGIGYTNDFLIGKTSSVFFNMYYQPNHQYRLFLNTSWSQYHVEHSDYVNFSSNNNLFTLEAGLTVNFKGKTPSASKKGTIIAQVYYDKNANDIFDEGDEIAPNYLITLNDALFKTDEAGKLIYRSVPFGSYVIKPVAAQGWFTNEETHILDTYKQYLSIPLHQNGTVSGRIKYEYDTQKIKKFQPKIAGILFNIYQNGKHIQRISTNNDGEFTVFLPSGTYQITLDQSSLASKTFCEETTNNFSIESGKTNRLPSFKIHVEQKSVHIKRFGN